MEGLVSLEAIVTECILFLCSYCVVIVSEWDNEEQFNGSPPRPQPRGPRTPPGPPPPDDDEEDALPVTGV